MALVTKPLDPATWPDFAQLAEDHHGAWSGCWCLGFHEEGKNGSTLNNATLSLFERHGFTRERRLGQHHWLVSRVIGVGHG